MQVLVEERLDLLLVHVAHLLRRHGDQVAVLVAALGGQLVDVFLVGDVVVNHAQVLQVGWVDGAAGVVELALVALFDG